MGNVTLQKYNAMKTIIMYVIHEDSDIFSSCFHHFPSPQATTDAFSHSQQITRKQLNPQHQLTSVWLDLSENKTNSSHDECGCFSYQEVGGLYSI